MIMGREAEQSPPPSRSEEARDTSPPLRGVEDTPSSAAAPILHPTQWGGGAERSEAEGGIAEPRNRSRRKPGITERARNLRWVDNTPEGLLWLDLRSRRLGGHHFTRQLPIGPYFVDFCCRRKKLVIEIDGAQHSGSAHDRRRDACMRAQGFSVMRFWSHDVLKHRTSVCETILAALKGRLGEVATAPDLRFVPAPDSNREPVRRTP